MPLLIRSPHQPHHDVVVTPTLLQTAPDADHDFVGDVIINDRAPARSKPPRPRIGSYRACPSEPPGPMKRVKFYAVWYKSNAANLRPLHLGGEIAYIAVAHQLIPTLTRTCNVR